ncbi:hypothetical protein [Microbacterium sp.]|uniref:hypothetical protein n=1 Tax=Microbacterium sp. TaxID=51671 RepID=UPI00281178E6|nr:hypothetical protein [Microbacterium sp.]
MTLIEETALRSEMLPTLQALPPRRPLSSPADSARVRWERTGPERYVVRDGADVLGYIDIVGAVFVVMAGARYDRATEVMQTLVFDNAIAALTGEADAVSRRRFRRRDRAS